MREEILKELTGNILPFWLSMKDPRGGFFGEMSGLGVLHEDADRGAILNARIIWAFSAASRRLVVGGEEYLDAARHAADYFRRHFIDRQFGGVYWSVDSSGSPVDTKKQLYSQGFAIYGLSELYAAGRDESVLNEAAALFKYTEEHFQDSLNGGYIEALARDGSPLEDMSLSAHDINADKTMNSHLHILEAYANLYKVWPDAALGARVKELLDLICNKVMDSSGHLRLYFSKEWIILPGGISYGHDIETSWLALECAMALGDNKVIERVKPFSLLLGRAGNEGLAGDGSMIYEKLPDGSSDRSRQWWVQAEAVVGNLWLWKYHGDGAALERARSCWNYIKSKLVDNSSGEWYWAVGDDGMPDVDNPKAGFWKCPYHNARMCLEALEIL